MSRTRVSGRVKQAVARRAQNCCEYCLSQARFSPDPLSVEHIVPRTGGGADDPSNLALSCQGCNNRKYTSTTAVDPVTGETVTLYHPRDHVWQEHFSWSPDFSLILAVSAIGRATVQALDLNREPVVNLRRVLRQVGEHPPGGDE
jgi:hypothetical protein